MLLDLLILAAIVGAIFFKLFKTLGTRPDMESKSNATQDTFLSRALLGKTEEPQRTPPPQETPPSVPSFDDKPSSSQERDLLKRVRTSDADFNRSHFLGGASKAFLMISKAYAERDKETLHSALDPKLFKTFEKLLEARQDQGGNEVIDDLSITEAHIDDAYTRGKNLYIAVLFVSTQKRTLYDDKGRPLTTEDDSGPQICKDRWVFKRPIHTEDPRWFLAETGVL